MILGKVSKEQGARHLTADLLSSWLRAPVGWPDLDYTASLRGKAAGRLIHRHQLRLVPENVPYRDYRWKVRYAGRP